MADSDTNIESLKELVRQFAAEREWQPFHSPKNLSMGLAVEAGELMERFLWIDGEASRRAADDPVEREAIADEMADVANYLLTLSYTLGIDLSEAIRAKVAKNAVKYPVEKCRGHYRVRE
jgi:NTP pyrophosphatase (non-canonical NTP hydrolase)